MTKMNILRATVAVGLLAALACGGREIDASGAVRGSDLRFLPRETAGLAVIEVARFKDRAAVTRWLDDFLKESGSSPGIAAVRGALGPETLDKVDRVALALVPVEKSTAYAVLVEGRFEETMVRNLTGGEGIVTLLQVPGQVDFSIAALPQNHLALGPRAVLELVRAGVTRPGEGFERAGLLRVLEKVSPAQQVWGAIDYGLLAALTAGAEGGSPVPVAGLTKNLKAIAFQGAIDRTVAFELVGLADAENGAKTLADAARGLVALARVGASRRAADAGEGGGSAAPGAPAADPARAWFEFLDALRIDQKGSEVRVHGLLDGTMARAFMAGATAPDALPGAPPPAPPASPLPAPR